MRPSPLFDLVGFRQERPTRAEAEGLGFRPERPSDPPGLRAAQNGDVIERLRSMGAELAARFGLRYVALEAEREGVRDHYGICYADGRIRIRLRHATTGRLLKASSLVDTLCHELAHLKHLDHSPRFRRLYWRILDEARRLDYYRPGPEAKKTRAGLQRSLFEDVGCGA